MFEVEDIVRSNKIFLTAKDKNLRYLYCNENLAEGIGLDSPHSMVGKNDFDLFAPNIANTYRSGDAHIYNGGIFVNVTEILPHTMQTIKILTTKTQLKNKAGKVIGVAISFIDATGLSLPVSLEILQYNADKKQYQFKIGDQMEHFTRREYAVFKFILVGMSIKQIAKKLNLSSRTIEGFLEKVKRKLQCGSKFQIAEAAMRLGIIHQNYLVANIDASNSVSEPHVSRQSLIT